MVYQPVDYLMPTPPLLKNNRVNQEGQTFLKSESKRNNEFELTHFETAAQLLHHRECHLIIIISQEKFCFRQMKLI